MNMQRLHPTGTVNKMETSQSDNEVDPVLYALAYNDVGFILYIK